jgi:uncharacterized membrane protein
VLIRAAFLCAIFHLRLKNDDQKATGRNPAPSRLQTRPWVTRALWSAAVLLVMIGAASAIGRGVFPADLATRAEPIRQQLLHSFDLADPFAQQRAAELHQFDSRFAAHPFLTLLHILPGGIFLVLALAQFSARIRTRYIRFHRWSGRILVLAGFVMGLTALYFGLVMPYAGPGEAIAIALFGGLFLVSLSLAFVAIRRRQVSRHRQWMIRAFAIAIAIATVRIVGAVLDTTLTPAGVQPKVVFVLAVWTGWLITLGAAELWIRNTRSGQ